MSARALPLALVLAACSSLSSNGDGDRGADLGGSGPGSADLGGSTVDGGTGDAGGLAVLELSASSLEVEAGGEEVVTLRVQAVVDGDLQDVTAEAVIDFVPSNAGTLVDDVFAPGVRAGPVDLSARWQGALAQLQIQIRPGAREVVAPVEGAPPIAQTDVERFVSAPTTQDPELAPRLLYPNDGVLLPRNLGALEVHYLANGNELFRVSFLHPNYELKVVTRCTPLADGCVYALGQDLYEIISAAAGGQEPVRIVVEGLPEGEETVGVSAQVEASFSAEDVRGALYYWTTSREAIMRVDFGAGNEPEQFFPFQGDSTCYGCHALSPDGERMTLSRSGQNDGRLFLLDVARGEIELDGTETNDREQFQTWAPDSQRFAGIWADSAPPNTQIRIRSGETGEVLETVELGHEPSHPNWSPAGDRIAYTRVTEHRTSQRPGRGGISYVEELPEGGWTTPREVIAPEDGLNYYNPAYALDGSFLLYNRSVCPDGDSRSRACDADVDPSAQIWAVGRDGGERVRLLRADGPGLLDEGEELTNTFPRWAPFEMPRFDDGEGRVMWMTFSSRRNYGLREPPGTGTLMWMAAVDPDAIVTGEDGSFPAFALPFQDLSTSNHIGQWTEVFVPTDPDPGNGGGDPGNGSGSGDPGNGSGGPECLPIQAECDGDPACCSGLACVDGICSSIN
ncbi:MAG: hypothetical protein AAF851_19855 [Myxococcota bacterium]